MKRRFWKLTALAVTGSVLLQLAGCVATLGDTLVQNAISVFFSVLFSTLLQRIVPAAA